VYLLANQLDRAEPGRIAEGRVNVLIVPV
jgi:hypothetical protein